MEEGRPPTAPEKPPRIRWRWLDYLLFGPNWGPMTPGIGIAGVFGLSYLITKLGAWITGTLGTGATFYGGWALLLLVFPVVWAVARGMVRGHYRRLVKIGEAGGCASCEYQADIRTARRCPECGLSLDRSLYMAKCWLAGL